jgi:hypothetical protein
VGILALGIAHFVLVLHGRKYWSNSWVYKLLARREFVSIYLTVFVLQGFFSKQDVDNFFLLSTVGFYLGIVFVGGDHIQSIWSKSSAAIRLLLSTVILLALITHAQYFATKQFGKIPRAVGGGMPEKAFLKISDQNLQTFTLLAGATGGHAPLSGGFVGPVSILLRSEKDLFFMDYSMPSPIRLVTNIAGVRITNIVTRLTTNVQWISTPKVGSPSAPQVSTNVTSIVTTNFSTNFVSVPATFTAQKVRADLVDAIIFIR